MKRNSSDLKEQRELQLVALEEVAKARRYDAAKAGGAASPKVPDLFTSQLRAIDGGLCRFLFACVCFFAEGLLQLVPVLCLRVLVLHFEQNDEDLLSTRAQWTIVAALYLAPSLGSLARARYDTEMVHVGCQMYSACSLALYEKALRLSPTARGDYEAGKIVTLFTVDAFSVQKLLLFIGILFSGPIIIVLCLYFIYQLVGEAMWIGLGFMIVCVPLQVAIFIPFLALQKAYLKAADERVKLMNEVLGGVRVVKFLAWERPFLEKITAPRRRVEDPLEAVEDHAVGFAVVMLGAPIFQPVLIFAYYTQKMGRELDSSAAFATLSLFSLLRLPLAFLPFCLIQFLTYQVSAKRMAAFLTQPELDERKGGGGAASPSRRRVPWVLNATVRDNVLFGADFDGDRFAACDGRIVAKGTYDELAARGVDMGELTVEEQPEEVKDADVAPTRSTRTELEGLHAAEQRQLREGALVKDEKTAEGLVSNMTWIVFAKAGGSVWLVVALTVMVAGRTSEIGGQFFLARWTSNHKDPNQSTVMDFVYYYLYYALGAVIALAIRALVLAYHRIKAASALHATVVERVLFAPTAFFDVTPVGRILNRFSGDMLTLDTELSRNMSEFCGIAMYVVGAIVALCAATKGLFLALFVPMGYAYRCIDRRFRTSSTQIARLAKLARSPVIADFSEILNGVATVRAYDAVKRFEDRLRSRLDALAACVVLEQLCYNWLSVRLDQLAAVSRVAALAVGTQGGFMNAGFLGLALMSTIEVTGFLKNAVRLSSLLASNMASGIDVEIPGGAHVGVVGRTGSGKSSLTAALFRVVELCGGSREIDGAPGGARAPRAPAGPLHHPQDPILFSASLRFNVDPSTSTRSTR
ncbi:ATPase [Aureococcus anophagefferens]|nr:ATPase [Aureococcus anophagefferens]